MTRTRSLLVALLAGILAAPVFGATDCSTPLQTYYVPFPAEQVKVWADDLKNDATDTDTILSVQSITITKDATVICYDHWEDGFDVDLRFPDTAGTSEIWGDGDSSNGCAPDVVTCNDANDVLDAGDIVLIEESVPANPRGTSILYDGQDKFLSSDAVKLSRAAWPDDAATTNTGSQLGGAVEVYDTNRWGSVFESPVGEDIGTNTDAWEWVAFTVMARADGTLIDVDLDGDGSDDYVDLALQQGESVLLQDVQVGATVVASAPVQVQIVTADVGSNYQGRWYSLVPRPDWDNSYYAPMPLVDDGDTNGDGLTQVHLYNPGNSSITVNVDHVGGGFDTTVNVPAGGIADYTMPCLAVENPCTAANRTAGHFSTADEADVFYAVSTVDAPEQIYDWGYTLVEERNLSTNLVVGWAKGSVDTATNISPVWVTTTADTTLEIDLDGDGSCIEQVFLAELEVLRIVDTSALFTTCGNDDNDQTGLIIKTSDALGGTAGTKITGVWGQDPDAASSGQPTQLDMGNVIVPSPVLILQKVDELAEDLDGNGTIDPGDILKYTIRVYNNGEEDLPVSPATEINIYDNLASGVTYRAGTMEIIRCSTPSDGCTPDTTSAVSDDTSPATTLFPLDCGTIDASTGECTDANDDGIDITSLDVGETAILEFEVSLDADYDDSTVTNTTVATSGTTQGSTSTATSPVPSGGLAITKTSNVPAGDGVVSPGETITYTVTVTNEGLETNTNVIVTDAVPNGTLYDDPSTEMTFVPYASLTVRDEFLQLYEGNDGTHPWLGSWVETDSAGDGPSDGEVRVVQGELRLNNDDDSGDGDESAARAVDLSGCTSATLTYDYDTSGNLEDDDDVSVTCGTSGTGGSFPTTLATYQNDVSGSASHDMSACISSRAAIRFLVTDGHTGSTEFFYVDDVQIAATGCSYVAPSNDGDALDLFETAAYDNQDGTRSWTSDWVETNDGGSPTGGDIFINGGSDSLEISDNGGGGVPSIARQTDLSGCTDATFSFQFELTGVPAETNDCVIPEASLGGTGGTFTALEAAICDDQALQTRSYDLDSILGGLSSTTAVRFRVTSSMNFEQWQVYRARVDAECPGDVEGVADLFEDVAYDNQDGTIPWTDDWTETNDDGSASSGDVFVDAGGDFLEISNIAGGSAPSIERSTDLENCTDGVLTYTFDTNSDLGNGALEGSDCMVMEASNNGGGAFSTLATICDDQNLQTLSHSLPFGTLSDDVVIRFRAQSAAAFTFEEWRIYEVMVDAVCPVALVRDNFAVSSPQLDDGDPTGSGALVNANDGVDLRPGDSIVITFDVEADDPLENVDAGIYNVATAESDQQKPITAFVLDPVEADARDAAIGDRVWLDVDGDGVQDVGEPGIANVTVELRDGVCTPLPAGGANCPTTTTDTFGNYLFGQLEPGTYTVAVIDSTLPDGGAGLTASPGTSDPTASITVAAGEAYLDADFGYTNGSSTDGIVGDRVWSDPDGDGIQDPGETGIEGVTVRLKSAGPDGVLGTGDDVVEDTTTTGPDGSYLFTGVTPGAYTVDVLTATLPGLGVGYSLTNGPQSRGNPTIPFTVLPGGMYLRADFGFDKAATFSITDAVWLDSDEDGLFDAGERPFADITIALLDSSGDVVATTRSGSDGSFSFSGLENGTYDIRVTDRDGTLVPYDGTTTFGEAFERTGLVVSGSDLANESFGYHARGAVGDTVFNDADQDGVQDDGEVGIEGVRVELLRFNGWEVIDGRIDVDGDGDTDTDDDADGPDGIEIIDGRLDLNGVGGVTGADDGTWRGIAVIDGELNMDGMGGVGTADDGTVDELLETAITGPDGMFLFSSRLPGQYRTNVTTSQTALSGFTQTADPDIPGNCGTPGSFCDSNGTAFVPVNGSDLTMDYGFRRDDPDVSGTVFEDLDRNAVQNGSEGGFEGVTLDLVKTYRVVNGRIDTDGDGDGDTADDGWADGVEVIDGLLDLDGDGSITGADDGTWRGFDVVNGFLDLDSDATTGEADDSDTIIGDAIATTTTDADGDYTFPNVPGSAFGRDYFVVVTDRDGILIGYELTTGIDTYPITVQTTDVTDIDFGYVRDAAVGSIGDTVWIDVDPPGPGGPDGLRGPTEPGIPGVTLLLYRDVDGDGVAEPGGDDGASIATTVTDANGNYVFDGLAPGFYFVDLDGSTVPAGLTLSAGTDPSSLIGLSEGERYLDADFGYRPSVGTSVLGDRVWYDADGDGRQDPGEIGLEGVDVVLFGPGANGVNDGPAVRVYSGRFDMDGDGDTDADDDGEIDGVAVIDGYLDLDGDGNENETNGDDDGLFRGFSVDDGQINLDGMGGIDAGDTGVSAHPLDTAAITTTGPDGIYLFTGLIPGTYSVAFDANDISALGLGTTPTNSPVNGANPVWAVTTAAGDVFTYLDWGFDGGTFGTVGDRVWLDSDGDGVQDDGERGLGGVTLNLVRVSDGEILATTTTARRSIVDGGFDLDGDGVRDTNGDDDGFVNGYEVIDGRLDLDGDGDVDDDDDGSWNGVDVVDGFLDLDGDGNSDGAGDDDGDTGDDGNVEGDYLFEGIPTGTEVQVVVTDLQGILTGLTATTTPANQTPADATPIRIVDFGFAPHPGAALGGLGTTVWHDIDGDGFRDPGEPPIEGVTITVWADLDSDGTVSGGFPLLFDPDGPAERGRLVARAIPVGEDNRVRSVTTDASGNYEVLGLPFGDYLVGVTDENGTLLPDFSKTSGTADLDDNSQTNPYPVTLTAVTPFVVVADFGFQDNNVDLPAALEGTVFLDFEDSMGNPGPDAVFQDLTEDVVPTATLRLYRLDDLGNRQLIGTTTSDVDGDYSFTDLAPGDYEIEVDVTSTTADGYLQTTQFSTGGVEIVSGLTAGETRSDLDFGFYDGGVVTTPVTLARFRAERIGAETFRVSWATVTEVSAIGFDVWGHDGEGWAPLTDQLVPSGEGDSLTLREYETEVYAPGVRSFLLAELDTKGRFRMHGPFTPEKLHGRTNEQLAVEPIDWTSIREGSRQAKLQRRGARGAAPVAAALRVDTTGLQRVTYEQLAAAGFDLAGVDADAIALVSRGEPVQIRVLSGPSFGPGAAIEFWGEAVEDSLYTRTNVFEVRVDAAAAERIDEASGAPSPGGPEMEHRSTWRFERDLAYSIGAPNGDPWFDRQIRALSGPQSTTVALVPDDFVVGTAELRIGLWGGIDWPEPGPDHHVVVRVNGLDVADEWFDGITAQTIEVELPAGWLVGDGTDELEILLPHDTGHAHDIVHFDHLELSYDRAFAAVDGELRFQSSGSRFTVGGLSNPNVTVLERSVRGDVSRLGDAAVTSSASGWEVAFSRDRAQGLEWFVVQEDRIATPDVESLGPPADLETGEARFLIVAHADFVDGLAPLVALRQGQGWTVDVVDVAEVLRQWGHGVFDPQPIRDYIAFAALERGTEAVLLVGGDTSDYLDHLGTGSMSFVPSIHARTGETVAFAPADGLYTDVDGDDVPDLAIGRFPVRTPAELDDLVAKTLAFEDGLDRKTLVAVNDDFDIPSGFDFEHATARFVHRTPADWAVEHISLDDVSVGEARPELLAALDEGPALTSFMGHSAPHFWTFDGLFNSNHAMGMANEGNPTLVTQWGCWTTLYTEPAANTLAHRFLVSGEQGAAAVLGATTLTEARSERALALQIADRLFSPGVTIGRNLLLAKRRLAEIGDPSVDDVLLGWVLLGDPTMPGFGGAGPALCEGDPATGDTDGDGICENEDLCIGYDFLGDTDGDGVCDDLDQCPGDDGADADGDGVCDALDACAGSDDGADSDADGVPDGCDLCLGDDAEGDPDGDGVCGLPSNEIFVDGFESGDASAWAGGR